MDGWLPNQWRRVDVARQSVLGVNPGLISLTVKTFLVPSTLVSSIVLPATLIGTLAAVVLPAAKRTAEILTRRVARMSEEANPAAAAAYRAVLKFRTIPQDRIQRELILTNKRTAAVVLVPILAKRKNFRDGYNKIARFSVKMLMVFSTSSSYSLDATASRGRARIFRARALYCFTQPIHTLPACQPLLLAQLIQLRCALLKKLLGNKNQDADSCITEEPSFFFSK